MYIGQIEYKMTENDRWHKGWLVGKHIDTAKTILDENFNPVSKIIDGEKEYNCWDKKDVMFSGVMIQI